MGVEGSSLGEDEESGEELSGGSTGKGALSSGLSVAELLPSDISADEDTLSLVMDEEGGAGFSWQAVSRMVGDRKHSANTSAVNDAYFFIYFLHSDRFTRKLAKTIVRDFIRSVNSGKMEGKEMIGKRLKNCGRCVIIKEEVIHYEIFNGHAYT